MTAKTTKKTTEKVEAKEVAIKEKVKKTAPKRVVVDRETEVLFMNNTSGNLFYKCPKTHSTYDMYEYGDTDYITVEQLMIMNNTSRKMLKELWILLIDTATEGVEISDVLKFLGIDSLYKNEINPEDMDSFVISSEDDKFENPLNKMDKVLAVKVVERAIVLYREGKLNSINKLNVIKELVGNEDLFE